MAPTIQTNKPNEQRPTRGLEKRSELVCRVKFCNTLSDIPFDPKFIQYPFDATRFIQYKPTTLERNYKYEVLTEHDLGVNIDLIDKDAYNAVSGALLDPADEKLLEEDILTPQDSKRSRHHARSVSWLRRTEYISTEQTRFQPQTMDKVEAKVGYSIKKNFKEDPLIMDRESQIKAIENTFEDSLKPIEKHYSKPNVHPVEILPVYPDFQSWKYPCAQVIFDSDPAPIGRSVPAQIEEMSQAMIRGVMDEEGEQFVAYFLPTEDTLEKRRADAVNNIEYEDDQEYEYKMAREYNWNVKNKASKGYEENYFLVVRQDGIFYDELETRVRLSKRRQKPGQAPSNTRLVVKHRPINELEYRMQRYRERQLEPPGEEDEESEPEPVPETVTITRTGDKPKTGEEKGSDDESDRSGSDKESRKGSDESGDDKKSRRSRSRSSRSGSKRSGSEGSDRSKKSGSPASKRSVSGGSDRSKRSASQTTKRSGSGGSERSKRSVSRTSKRSGSEGSDRSKRSGSQTTKRSGSGGSGRSKRSVSRTSKRSGSGGSGRSKRSASRTSKRSGSGGSDRSKRSGSGGSERSKRSASHTSKRSGSGGSDRSRRSGSRTSKRSGSGRSDKSKHSGSRISKRSGSGGSDRSKRSGSETSKRSGSGGSDRSKRSGSRTSKRSGSGDSRRSASGDERSRRSGSKKSASEKDESDDSKSEASASDSD